MLYQEIPPDDALRPFLDAYIVLPGKNNDQNLSSENIPAKICRGLVFSNGKGRSPLTNLSSVWLPERIVLPHNNNKEFWRCQDGAGHFVVVFKPGKFKWLFPFPVLEFIEKPAIKTLSERPFKDYCQQAMSAGSTVKRVNVSNVFLTERVALLNGRNELTYAALNLLHGDLGLSMSDIAYQLGVTDRHFRRVFSSEMGIQPKLFQKMLRISTALQIMDEPGKCKILDIAYECGFFDQSHFDNNFKSITGITPSHYLNNNMAPLPLNKAETIKEKKNRYFKNSIGDVRFFLFILIIVL